MDLFAAGRLAALLERDDELARVHAGLRSVGQRAGLTMVIEGPAGVGKSRLLDEARVAASRLGFRVLHARGTELEQGFPYGVMRQLFERLLLEVDAGERDRWQAGAAALAGEVLTCRTKQNTSGAPSSAPPDDQGYAWQHGLYWLTSHVAVDSPVVLIVDDLQWCDAPSARALAFIARRLDGLAAALIFASRPLDPVLTPEAAALSADPATEMLRPSPLTLGAVGALVAARLSAEPDARFVRACFEVTGGNPFLLGQLLAEASAREVRPTASAAAGVASIVPRGVANAVLLRLARLAPSAGPLLGLSAFSGTGPGSATPADWPG